VGSQVIVLLKLPVPACLCVHVWAALAVFPCGPLEARLAIWSRDLSKLAEQSGWVGLVAGRETNPRQADTEAQNNAPRKTILKQMMCLFEKQWPRFLDAIWATLLYGQKAHILTVRAQCEHPNTCTVGVKFPYDHPFWTRTRNLRIRSPTLCPLGQGGHVIGKLMSPPVEALSAALCVTDRADRDNSAGDSCRLYSCGCFFPCRARTEYWPRVQKRLNLTFRLLTFAFSSFA
jgi:hypothetical protein